MRPFGRGLAVARRSDAIQEGVPVREAAGETLPDRIDRTLRPDYGIEAWRSDIPILESMIPMNNCSHSPQTGRTRAAALEYLDLWDRKGMDWDAWLERVHDAKASFASLTGATPEEVAVTTSVSAATNSLASALDFGGGRTRIVVSGAEFPSVGQIWKAQERRGANVAWVPVREGTVRLEDYEAAIDDRTLLVSACHAYYQNGFVQDIQQIAELAHASGALLFVDAYQSLGTRPVDVEKLGVDVLASGVLKYLMGVPGIAFMYVKGDRIDDLRPAATGWFGRKDPFAFDPQRLDWHATARRFETGTPPIPASYVAHEGMEIIREVGPERIRPWMERLTGRMIDRGEELGLELHGTADPRRKTPCTAFVCSGADAASVEAELRKRGVLASARGSCIRLAPHFYSTLDEVDHAVDELARILVD